MFDVIFQGKNEELSAAKLRDKMQQIITQASIEEEKAKKVKEIPIRKHAWKRSINEDPDKIVKVEKIEQKLKNSAKLVRQNKVSIDSDPNDSCNLSIRHRHDTSVYDSPDCSADMHEFRLSLILTTFYSVTIHILLLVICFRYNQEHKWQVALALQLISCVFQPLFEFMLSPRVRFYVKDWLSLCKGEEANDTVIVA